MGQTIPSYRISIEIKKQIEDIRATKEIRKTIRIIQ